MAYEDFIGFRYLMAKRRSRVVSIITLFAVAGVALGVTALIVVLSVMGGFKKDLKQKILGTKAHIVIKSKDGSPLKNPEELASTARSVEGIVGAAPFVSGETMASSPTNLSGMMLRGIPPNRIGEVSDLEKNLGDRSSLDFLSEPSMALEEAQPSHEGSLENLMNEEGIELDEQRGTGPSEGSKDPDTTTLSEALTKSKSTTQTSHTGVEEADSVDAGPPAKPSSEQAGGMPPVVPPGEKSSDSSGSQESVTGQTSDGESVGEMPPIAGNEQADTSTKLPGLLLGVKLAESLQVDIGDEINVVTPRGEMGPTGPIPSSRPFLVVGTFRTGMYEYDANLGYTHIEDASDFLGVDGATGIELKSSDPERALALAGTLKERLPDHVEVQDWRDMNQSLFFALQLEKIGMFLMLTLIIIVASFSIVAMLIMIVLEKSRDISVLKSLGVDRSGIMRIFMFQGVFIGCVGAAIGSAMGLGICWGLIEFGLPLNSEVYYIKTLPVDVQWSEVAVIVVSTIIISFLATLYPSLRAASLRPVEGLRYE